MENTSNNMNMPEHSSGNKKSVLITIIAGVVILCALIWWLRLDKSSLQVPVGLPPQDAESAAINQDVNNIDVGDLNAEFEAIDKDLLGL